MENRTADIAGEAPRGRLRHYVFALFSSDRFEPPHVHVVRDRASAKFWLDPVELAKQGGYKSPELRRIERLVVTYREQLLEAWDDYFDA